MKALLTSLIIINYFQVTMSMWQKVLQGNVANNKNGNLRIIGGNDAGIIEAPYTVSFQALGKHFCGGSIISHYWVISAAHCFLPLIPVPLIEIRSGSTFTHIGGSIHRIRSICSHERFEITDSGRTMNDIAVVRVYPRFHMNRGIRRAIRLFEPGQVVPNRAVGLVSGWGLMHETDKNTPFILQKIRLPLFPKQRCFNLLKRFGGIAEDQFCAGYLQGERDACQGDSGGPYVINDALFGIVSWGKGCARRYLPGAYTEVSVHREWIKKHTRV